MPKTFPFVTTYLSDMGGDIPIGNAIPTFAELLADWRGPLYYPLIGMNHVYMPVGIG